ncbi:MAG: hypothetical protein ABIO65_00010 [Nitrospiria bacterium]
MGRGSTWRAGSLLLLAVWSPVWAEDAAPAIPALTAEMEQQVMGADGNAATTAKLFLTETGALVEPDVGSGRAGYAEYHLYDFAGGRFYRVFPDDRIYFDLALSLPLALRAFIEGWAPAPKEAAVRDIPLKNDTVNGTAARLVLVERRLAHGRAPEYTFVWRATDASRLPLKVIYVQDGRTLMVSYRALGEESIDPARFAVPEGFSNLSPF